MTDTLDQRLAAAAEWCRQRPEAAHIAAVIDEVHALHAPIKAAAVLGATDFIPAMLAAGERLAHHLTESGQ